MGSGEEVTTVKTSDLQLDQLSGVELMVAGSPTRGFRPSDGMMNFLNKLAINRIPGVKVVAFDTRLALSDIESGVLRLFVRVGGYAAPKIAGRLKKCGGELILPPEGFLVKASEGPLKDGEIERAKSWATSLRSLFDK